MQHERTYRDEAARSAAARGNAVRDRARGMTVLELLITMAVIGMLMTLGYYGVRALRDSSLREDTTEVASVLRAAYNMATVSGIHHRVVFDLEEQTYRIEACEGQVTLRRSDEEEVPEEPAGAAADDPAAAGGRAPGGLLPRPGVSGDIPAEILAASSPEEATNIAAALAGTRVGTARCQPPELDTGDADGRGAQRRLRTEDGLKFRRIFVQHLEGEQERGMVHLNFFPLGYAEKAVIEIGDDDGNAFTLLVHRLTGRVEFREGKVDPEDHMMRRADGERVDER